MPSRTIPAATQLVFLGCIICVVSVAAIAGAAEIRAVTGTEFFDGDPGQIFPDATSGISEDEVVRLDVVEDTLSITRNGEWMTVVGEVSNGSDLTAVRPVIQIAVLDEAGELLNGTETVVFGNSWILNWSVGPFWDIVGPGENGWFSASIHIWEWDEVGRVLVQSETLGRDVNGNPDNLELVGDWEVEEVGDGVLFTGVVRNVGNDDIVGLNVTLGLRTHDGRMLSANRAYPREDRIGGYLGGLRRGADVEVLVFARVNLSDIDFDTLETRFGGVPYFEGVSGSFTYKVAGVAHNPGRGGALWRSSLTVTNHSGGMGRVPLIFRHAGEPVHKEIELDDGESILWDDVVDSLFDIEGDATGYVEINSTVPLVINGRTCNETAAGTLGQSLPVLQPSSTWGPIPHPTGILSSLRGGDRFRSNVGLINLGDESCSAHVRVFDPSGSLMTDLGQIPIDPRGWRQLNDILPVDVEHGYATVESEEWNCRVWAYASVIDENSGDPTTVELTPDTSIYLTPGYGGGPFGRPGN